MCGIVGVLSSEHNRGVHLRKKFLVQALIMDTLRGFDSTGMFLVNPNLNPSVDYIKRVMPGWDFVDLKSVNKLVEDLHKYRFAIGHNRAATRGKVTQENAHPFDMGSLIGVHNGTLTGVNRLPEGSKFDVDSQALLNSIQEIGADETFKKTSGAVALVWYDYNTERLNIIRNSERPLHYAMSTDEDTIFIASEAGMLRSLLNRNGIKYEGVVPFDEEVQYTFNPANIKQFSTIKRKFFQFAATTNYSQGSHAKKEKEGSGAAAFKGNNVLEKLNIRLGDEVEFWACDWRAYSARPHSKGAMEGFMQEEPHYQVVVHSITKEDASSYDAFLVKGKVRGACYPKGDTTREPELILDPNSIEFVNIEDDTEEKEQEKLPGKSLGLPNVTEERGKDVGNVLQISGKTKAEQEEDEWEDDVPFYQSVKGPAGVYIPVDAFKQHCSEGCANCTGPISSDDAEKIGWTIDKQPICPECMDDIYNSGMAPGFMLQ